MTVTLKIDQMIDKQIRLMKWTKVVHSLQEARVIRYLSGHYWHNAGWNEPLGMPLLLKCFLHVLPTASTMARLLHFDVEYIYGFV